LKLVEAIPLNVADTDMKPHIMKLRKSEAQAVLLFVGPGHVARLQGTGKAMKFEPQWMSTTTCGDFPLMMAITKGLYAGTIAAGFGMLDPGKIGIGNVEHLDNPSLPLMQKYKRDAFGKFAQKGERWGMTFCAGIGYVEPFVEALRRVGRDLTREKVIAEMEKLENFQGIMGHVTYKPFKADDPLTRIGQQEIFLNQCMPDGTAKILTNWIKTTYIPMQH